MSVPEAESTMIEGDGDGIVAYSTVDEMFTQLSVPQIQKLNREYKTKIEQTKADLHTLVGSKYRDLIKIAEDIDEMYKVTSSADSKLAELSYKKSRFIPFTNTNNHAKFNTLSRIKVAKDVKKNARLTIVRDIVNNRLQKLDLKMATNESGSPLVHTSNLIYYAKVYYTVETLFPDLLQENVHLRLKFLQFKNNFIEYLETELSSYSLFDNAVYGSTNDRVKSNQRLVLKELVNTRPMALNEDIEILDDAYQEENYEANDETAVDGFENEEYIQSKKESYSKVLPPIINYLIAYTIVNRTSDDLNTLSKIIEKFVSVRYTYLSSLLEQSADEYDPTRINFFRIFKYVENTCSYLEKYLKKRNSSYFKALKTVTQPWKASNLIGFRDWIDEEDVRFDQDIYLIELPTSVSNDIDLTIHKLPTLIYTYFHRVVGFESSKSDTFPKILSSLLVFHNFFYDLIHLFDYTTFNESKSRLIDLITGSKSGNILVTLTQEMTKKIEEAYSQHYDQLISSESPISIISVIKEHFKENGSVPTDENLELFSSELSTLMDDSLEKYIKEISEISFSSSKDSVSESISKWFDKFTDFDILVDISKESDTSRLNSFNCLSNLHSYLSRPSNEAKQEILWGSFTNKWFDSEFSQLCNNMNASFSKCIAEFVNQLEILLQESKSNDIESHYYLLNGLLSVKERILEFEGSKLNLEGSLGKIETLCTKLYGNLVESIPEKSFYEAFDSFIEGVKLDQNTDDLPTRPSLKLISLMYNLATEYLSAGGDKTKYKYEKLFSSIHVKGIFKNSKDEWIRKRLIEERILKAVADIESGQSVDSVQTVNLEKSESDESTTKEEVTEDIEKEEGEESNVENGSSSSRIPIINLFANFVFLVQFAEKDSEAAQEWISTTLSAINKSSSTPLIDEVTSKIVVRSITEYYTSTKGIYLPLSV
ncbi:uncharacterized protein RJT20DRAFT_126833 [Scheffersomyces xylosifermentans]|uniref:uncharacterized protein n=1 Tax=Scheffersomyces xylosifermentans TaxID=1304137 RepID=UPI00315CB4BC